MKRNFCVVVLMMICMNCFALDNPFASPESMVRKAEQLYDRGKDEEAFDLYYKAAEKGNTHAQYAVGFMYRRGQGTREDYTRARRWLEMAARSNYAPAQKELGDIYAYGLGVEQDTAKAREFYKKAIDNGSDEAADALKDLDNLSKSIYDLNNLFNFDF